MFFHILLHTSTCAQLVFLNPWCSYNSTLSLPHSWFLCTFHILGSRYLEIKEGGQRHFLVFFKSILGFFLAINVEPFRKWWREGSLVKYVLKLVTEGLFPKSSGLSYQGWQTHDDLNVEYRTYWPNFTSLNLDHSVWVYTKFQGQLRAQTMYCMVQVRLKFQKI